MLDFERLVAPNPGPMTLEGTNTYVVGRDPCWVIDPGPDDAGHIERVRAAGEARGGIAGYLLTHCHGDHSEGIEALGAPPAAEDAPFERIPTPGHAADHVSFVAERVCFCGDLILGHGSAIVPPAEMGGSLADYMRSLELVGALDVDAAGARPRPADRAIPRQRSPSTSSTGSRASARCSRRSTPASARARGCSTRPGPTCRSRCAPRRRSRCRRTWRSSRPRGGSTRTS